jgi:transmembrane sensor
MTDTSDLTELRAIRAQAALWVTDLHGPERSPALEAGLRRWLAENPKHAQAFELATEAWQRSGNLSVHMPEEPRLSIPLGSPRLSRKPRRRSGISVAGAAALALILS